MPDNWLPTGFALANSLLPNSRGAALGLQAAAVGMLGVEDSQEHPPAGCAPDAIKLFVGNIPKSCTEQQLLPFFETIGKVVELVIVRDKTFHESKVMWYASGASAVRGVRADRAGRGDRAASHLKIKSIANTDCAPYTASSVAVQ